VVTEAPSDVAVTENVVPTGILDGVNVQTNVVAVFVQLPPSAGLLGAAVTVSVTGMENGELASVTPLCGTTVITILSL
jgi:hypothetical protein